MLKLNIDRGGRFDGEKLGVQIVLIQDVATHLQHSCKSVSRFVLNRPVRSTTEQPISVRDWQETISSPSRFPEQPQPRGCELLSKSPICPYRSMIASCQVTRDGEISIRE